MRDTPPVDPGRRDVLRGAIAMPAALGVSISAAAWLTGCSRQPAAAQGYLVLRPQDLPMLEKLIPATVGSVVPADREARAVAVQAAVRSYDQLLADTSPSVRAVFLPLLDLMTMGVSRGPLFGLWKSWHDATTDDAAAFLERWAPSSTQFMRGAYNGFITLATMAWYLEPAHGASAGYPGPPRKIVIDAA